MVTRDARPQGQAQTLGARSSWANTGGGPGQSPPHAAGAEDDVQSDEVPRAGIQDRESSPPELRKSYRPLSESRNVFAARGDPRTRGHHPRIVLDLHCAAVARGSRRNRLAEH